MTVVLFSGRVNFSLYGVSFKKYNINMREEEEALFIRSAVAKILRNKMKDLGYSLRKVEEISGVSKTTVARIVNGESDYSVNNLAAISRALGLVPWKVLKQAETSLAESLTKPAPLSVMSREERIASVDRKLRDGSYLTKAAAKEWDARTEIEQNPFYT